MINANISTERVRELFIYEPETGKLFRKIRTCNRVQVGEEAGAIKKSGYRIIYVDGKNHRAHRLIWLYVNGCWPCGDIDHMDGDRANNRMSNLRDVSRSVNMQNIRKPAKNGKCQLLGVTMNGKRWMARIKIHGIQRHLGTYEAPEFAHGKYLSVKRIEHSGCTI